MTRATLGLLAPLTAEPFAHEEAGAVRDALRTGLVDAVWARDLPLVPAGDTDAGQGDDPFAYLAGVTAGLDPPGAVGTASVILGIRHPLVVARAAVGAQLAARGRFVLGVGGGV